MDKVIRKKSIEKREYILEKAENVFKRKGFVNVTMQDIVDECKISRGGLYKYFATTSEVFEGILRNSQKDRQTIERQIRNNVGFYDIMKSFYEEQAYELLHPGDSIRVATYEYFINQRSGSTKAFIQNSFDSSVSIIMRLITYGMERKEIRKVDDIEALAFHIVAWLEGLNLIAIVTDMDEVKLAAQFEKILCYFKEG